jgi:hypothetical protein
MNSNSSEWTAIEPLLDEAMEALDPPDRTAILLRYFEDKSLREVGKLLGTSENAAQKRVSRALDQLREFFSKRGLAVGVGVGRHHFRQCRSIRPRRFESGDFDHRSPFRGVGSNCRNDRNYKNTCYDNYTESTYRRDSGRRSRHGPLRDAARIRPPKSDTDPRAAIVS